MASINLKSRKSLAIILAIVAATIGVVSKLALTSGELLPGIDGAYYWVQVRSILDDFTLAFDDLPLVFWAQSLLALIVGDIPLGVRISDALFSDLLRSSGPARHSGGRRRGGVAQDPPAA